MQEAAPIVFGPETAWVCVFGVDSNDYDPEFKRLLSLREVAAGSGLEAACLDSETLLFDRLTFDTLLQDLSHFNLSAIGLCEALDEAALTDLVVKAMEAGPNDGGRVLLGSPAITAYASSHDDCYLYAETRRVERADRLLSYLIQTYASAATGLVLPPMDASQVSELGSRHRSFSIESFEFDEEARWIRLPYVHARWSPRTEAQHPPAGHIAFDCAIQVWSLED